MSDTPLNLPRAQKALAVKLVAKFSAQYLDAFRQIQQPDGWRTFAQKINAKREQLGIDKLVVLYENELFIGRTMMFALHGKDEAISLEQELEKADAASQQEYLDEMASYALDDEDDEAIANLFSDDPDYIAQQRKLLEAMPEDEKAEATKRAQWLYGASIASLYNCLAVMIHGEKMTSLVPKAIQGNRVSFYKAVHIDKVVLHAHPGLRQQHETAIANQDKDFLSKLAYRSRISPTQGKIQYPGVFMVFAMLESMNWLWELKREEILDVCDQAGLDRYENRIEDVGYLTKRLLDYKRYQTTGGVSMH